MSCQHLIQAANDSCMWRVFYDLRIGTGLVGDLIEVIRKLGGLAMIVGQSFSGGATTIAAATNPIW